MLVGKYVPNLVAKTFDVSKEYAQLIYDQTLSPRLDKVLRKWDQDNWGADEHRQKLAYIILVELLAYQFASPVRWIETQDILFSRYNFERFVEIATKLISRAPFFAVCVAVVVIWAASYPLWKSTTKWELAIHTFTAVLSLLLLVLLENAGRRNTEAMQEKLNVLAEALAALMESRASDDPELEEAAAKLREAVGLEEQH